MLEKVQCEVPKADGLMVHQRGMQLEMVNCYKTESMKCFLEAQLLNCGSCFEIHITSNEKSRPSLVMSVFVNLFL